MAGCVPLVYALWASGVLGVCGVVLGALEAGLTSWCPRVLLGLRLPALRESVGLGCSSGAQQVVVDLSPPHGGEGTGDCLSPT